MDSLLLILALVSLAAALGFGVMAWRALDDQRRRSAARVATLSAAIHADAPAAPVAVASLFDRTSGSSVQGRPLIKAGILGTGLVALIVFVTMATSRDAAERPEVEHTAQTVTAAAASPLELMTMKHVRDGDALKVTGVVRNPSGAAQVSHIVAVVSAYDRDGGLVATAHAPVDFTVLAPGDESPFVVAVPSAASVARYRVSFRTDTGTLRHIDRRTASQFALAQ